MVLQLWQEALAPPPPPPPPPPDAALEPARAEAAAGGETTAVAMAAIPAVSARPLRLLTTDIGEDIAVAAAAVVDAATGTAATTVARTGTATGEGAAYPPSVTDVMEDDPTNPRERTGGENMIELDAVLAMVAVEPERWRREGTGGENASSVATVAGECIAEWNAR
jgi:hypothetical protein